MIKIDSNFTRLPQIAKVLTFQNVVENWRISVLECSTSWEVEQATIQTA